MPPQLFDCYCQAVLVTPGGKSNPVGVLSQKDGLEPFKTPSDVGHWQAETGAETAEVENSGFQTQSGRDSF